MGKEFNNGESSRGVLEKSIEIRGVQLNGIIGMITTTTFAFVVNLSKDRTARREGIRRRHSRRAAHGKHAQIEAQM